MQKLEKILPMLFKNLVFPWYLRTFWERMELDNVKKNQFEFIVYFKLFQKISCLKLPFDLQQLNVVIRTKMKTKQIKLLADVNDFFITHLETKRTFVDQQKWRFSSGGGEFIKKTILTYCFVDT